MVGIVLGVVLRVVLGVVRRVVLRVVLLVVVVVVVVVVGVNDIKPPGLGLLNCGGKYVTRSIDEGFGGLVGRVGPFITSVVLSEVVVLEEVLVF